MLREDRTTRRNEEDQCSKNYVFHSKYMQPRITRIKNTDPPFSVQSVAKSYAAFLALVLFLCLALQQSALASLSCFMFASCFIVASCFMFMSHESPQHAQH